MGGKAPAAAPSSADKAVVVVVTPNDTDRELTHNFLGAEGLPVRGFPGLSDIDVPTESIGCLLLVEESLTESELELLQQAVQMQPAWSEIPILLVAGEATPLSDVVNRVFPAIGNVTLLQRPLHPVTLVSSVRAGLRARRRQLQVRDLLNLREAAVRQRDEFLAMLAHELRNPLVPIRNAVYLMGTLKVHDPLFAKCRGMIDKQAGHITRLVDDLLDVSRLELGKVELRLEPVDVNEAIAAAAEACGALTSSHRHHVRVRRAADPLQVMADPVRLEQSICNLIVNAAKFTPTGGAITVEAVRDGDEAVVAITDTGVGIRPEMLESIFDLFTQSDATIARTEGGLGIGLTLVRRLVELHGGRVRAFSGGVGRGARFEARLPLAGGEFDAPEPAAPRADPRAPRRVLVVEDGADNRESLGTLLQAWNHEVFYAATGPEGVERACQVRPDVALIDIGLPGYDGYDVARRIRKEAVRWSQPVRLIALTGYGQASDRQRALDAGFDVHVLKPVDPEALRALLG